MTKTLPEPAAPPALQLYWGTSEQGRHCLITPTGQRQHITGIKAKHIGSLWLQTHHSACMNMPDLISCEELFSN